MADALRTLVDRAEISELLARYAWMVDRKQWGLMDEVFAPGATIDYTSSGGVKDGYREALGWLRRALEPWPLNLHCLSNLTLEIDGDRARSRCYFHAPLGRVDSGGTQHFVTNQTIDLDGDVAHVESYYLVFIKKSAENVGALVGGRYADRFERRDGVWKIALRVVLPEWQADADARNTHWVSQAGAVSGARNRTDITYQRPMRDPPPVS